MLLNCHSGKSHPSCPAKTLCTDLTQKLPSAAWGDTTLTAGKAQNQATPITRNLCCRVAILGDPGYIFSALHCSFPSCSFAGFRPWDGQCETASHSVFTLCLTQRITVLDEASRYGYCVNNNSWHLGAPHCWNAATLKLRLGHGCDTSHRAHIKWSFAKDRRWRHF